MTLAVDWVVKPQHKLSDLNLVPMTIWLDWKLLYEIFFNLEKAYDTTWRLVFYVIYMN